MRTFRRTELMPECEVHHGPGGAPYMLTNGIRFDLDDAIARGWLVEVPREELLADARARVADLEGDPFA